LRHGKSWILVARAISSEDAKKDLTPRRKDAKFKRGHARSEYRRYVPRAFVVRDALLLGFHVNDI
jgi:hypothetical protein